MRAGAGRAGRGGLSHRGVVFFESAITWYFEDPARGQDPLRRAGSQGAAACGVGGGLSFLASYLGNSNSGSLPSGAAQVPPRGGGRLRGAAGASPALVAGRLLPPLLALGFSDGYKAYPAPPAPGASLVFQQDWAGGRPAAACRASGVQRPQGPPWRPRCLQGPTAGCPALQRPRLLPQTPLPTLLFGIFSSHPLPSQPQGRFPLYKQLSCQEAISFQV